MPVKASIVALLLGLPLVLAGCGKTQQAVPATVTSDAYSCTGSALARLADLRSAVADAVPDRASGPRVRNYCDGGLDAGVELTVPGTLDQVLPDVRRALHCENPSSRPAANGRSAVMRCHTQGMTVRTTLSPYLPADDPKGPTTLAEATLVSGR